MIAELRQVSKRFHVGREVIVALDKVDLKVEAGEFACAYGASGSGKTTLLNMLAGLDTADSGEVTILGTSLNGINESQRAHIRLTNIGVVFQANNLLPDFTAVENVALPLLVQGFSKDRAWRAAREALDSFRILDLGDRLPKNMSGGQRQRVGIARALAGEQVLLVADEPTGALDSENSNQLFKLLRSLCDERKTAVVLATHDPLAKAFADVTYVMVDGVVSRQ